MLQNKDAHYHCGRRKFMYLLGAGAGCFLLGSPAVIWSDASSPSKEPPKKPLVVYFSKSGHTRKIAEDIRKALGAEIIEIETVAPYPDDYDELVKQAQREQEKNARPQIKTRIDNLDQYGVVFLGYPNWWSSMPMPVYTFIEENKLDGKTIAPFVTHGGGHLGHSIDDLKRELPHSRILKPLAVSGNAVDRAEKDVEKWLEGLGTALIETTTGNPQIYPDGAY